MSVARKIPLGNGILTVDTEAQAWARAKMDEADKGGDAARAALAMLAIKRDLAKGETAMSAADKDHRKANRAARRASRRCRRSTRWTSPARA